MTPLPIDPVLPAVLDALRDRGAVVLVAPPGSGKTTRVPPAILRSGLLAPSHPGLILLQPRRVATRASAARIAEENGWTLGKEVGYQVRFERRIGPRTRLRVQTEGILNRQLVIDPWLEGTGCVILDEFHERSLHTDLAVALLREIRDNVRDDLKLVVMSATLDADPIARFLGNAPIIRAEGRTFPVSIAYRPTTHPAAPESIAAAVSESLQSPDDPGHLLVFLPGADEIRRAGHALGPLANQHDLDVIPLHGALPADDQDRALRPGPRRKVILATNIAETSLTIDGVRTVIDTGLARFATDDPARGLDRLELGRISLASADQRAGRAGRTAPGRCLRLWSEREHRALAPSDPPEVARVDLASAVLALRDWNSSDPSSFGWFEPPPPDRLAAAERLLVMLGALEDPSHRITPLGRGLLMVPAHPRLARLLIAAAMAGHPRHGAALAALLSEKDIATRNFSSRPGTRGTSDLLDRLDRFHEAERRRFDPSTRSLDLDPSAARRVARARDDLARAVRRFGRPDPRNAHACVTRMLDDLTTDPDESDLLRWILLAYPDRVVRRRGSESTGVMVGGRGIRLAPESIVRDHEFFLALDPREDRRGATLEAKVRIASAIDVQWLEDLFPQSLRRDRTVLFDDDRARPVVVTSLFYRDLKLREDRNARLDPAEASAALAASLADRAEAFLRADASAALWLDRLAFLRHAMPEAAWPEFDPETLASIVADACAGKRTLDEVRQTPLVPLLRARLPHAQARALDDLAPETLTVPSGSRIKLTYDPGRPPVLAARLQELFGWTDTPRLAAGRVPVLLHLLGPNYRPVQITHDLKSFWADAYFQVRKDLRSRYPKHAWPDDPLTARPEARGSRRP